jgi:hypothetical protein
MKESMIEAMIKKFSAQYSQSLKETPAEREEIFKGALESVIKLTIEGQLEELEHFAKAFRPEVKTMIAGWCQGKRAEAGIPKNFPKFYDPNAKPS